MAVRTLDPASLLDPAWLLGEDDGAGVAPDTRIELGGIYDQSLTGGIYDQSVKGATAPTALRGGNYDQSLTGGELD